MPGAHSFSSILPRPAGRPPQRLPPARGLVRGAGPGHAAGGVGDQPGGVPDRAAWGIQYHPCRDTAV